MPEGQYGPGGKWIHDRAHRIMESMGDQYSPEKKKAVAYATATQQAHKVGKSPKDFRTPQGVHEAKAKHDKPKSEYQKTAAQDILGRGESNMIDIAMVNGFVDELEKIAAGPDLTRAAVENPRAATMGEQNLKTMVGGPRPQDIKASRPVYRPEQTARDFAPGAGAKEGAPGVFRRGWKALGRTWRSGAGGKAAIIGIPLGLAAAGGIGGTIAARRRQGGQNVTVVR